ncbi:hypothetical protein BD324DRAFT_634498 [Kockovaella imperatae]|uniref:Uncharacterized protein n=1 Tax=Kockovaella imperatae TaxID=4999 RepID=A0A1Y1U9H9_9TREE|nr:hypothetical protein BD324DRAFT_634498 [Kockovaella imperatae]ORX34689.1 hypothetical protein BD324DRAFT_634498 [Kockovaella imperatae]
MSSSSFMVLRASSSRRSISSLVHIDAGGRRPSHRPKDRFQIEPVPTSITCSRSFTSSAFRHASTTTESAGSKGTTKQSAFQERMAKQEMTMQQFSQKKRIQAELHRRHAGLSFPLFNDLTYAPLTLDMILKGLTTPGNLWRHLRHRWMRDDITMNMATQAEGATINALKPDYVPRVLNPYQKVKHWLMKRGATDAPEIAYKPQMRYASYLARAFDQWKIYNEALASRDTALLDQVAVNPAIKLGHVLMSSNRIVDWQVTKEFAKPELLWMRLASEDERGVSAYFQVCVRFDTEQVSQTTIIHDISCRARQTITTVETSARPELPVAPTAAPGKRVPDWKLREYRDAMLKYQYQLATDLHHRQQGDMVFPEGVGIKSLKSVQGLPRHTETSRVIDNVVFQFTTAEASGPWKVRERVPSYPPHYMMTEEAWEELQRKSLETDEKMGVPSTLTIHHVNTSEWNKRQRLEAEQGSPSDDQAKRIGAGAQ